MKMVRKWKCENNFNRNFTPGRIASSCKLSKHCHMSSLREIKNDSGWVLKMIKFEGFGGGAEVSRYGYSALPMYLYSSFHLRATCILHATDKRPYVRRRKSNRNKRSEEIDSVKDHARRKVSEISAENPYDELNLFLNSMKSTPFSGGVIENNTFGAFGT